MKNDLQYPCDRCGKAMATESRESLMESVNHSMCNGVEPSSPAFVKLMLHAIGVQIFGGLRFACNDCQELFSSCPRSFGCRAGASRIGGLEEYHSNFSME